MHLCVTLFKTNNNDNDVSDIGNNENAYNGDEDNNYNLIEKYTGRLLT